MTVATINLWGQCVGAVAWDAKLSVASFEYEPNFSQYGWPIGPINLPCVAGKIYRFSHLAKETFHGLPGLLADALPDDFGNQVIASWLARQGRTFADFDPVERLCYIGQRAMGALEFQPALYEQDNDSSRVELDALVELAGQIIQERQAFLIKAEEEHLSQQTMQDILKVSTSAGGARPKAILAIDPTGKDIRSGQVLAPAGYQYWVLKFDGITDNQLCTTQDYGRIEYVYNQLAQQAGIKTTSCRLLEENGRAHFMSQRFDRTASGDKLHVQSLCAIAHYDYRKAGFYSYEQLFSVMRTLKLTYPDMEQQFRRMVFNVIARNQDDHTKNVSFMMDKTGTWQLSPAYDITYSFNPHGIWTHQHQMQINGKLSHFTRDDLMMVAKQASIKQANFMIDEIIEAVSRWEVWAKKVAISENVIKQISQNLLLEI